MAHPRSPAPMRARTDLPAMLLHWGLVAALLLSVSTGWCIAGMQNDNLLLHWLEVVLPQGTVLRWHFWSATAMVALVVAYLDFLWRTDLGGRLALRSANRAVRWQAVNRLMYRLAFALLGSAAVTGLLLYFSLGVLPTESLAQVHQWLSWGFVGYIALHIATQLAFGGWRQSLKIVTLRVAYGAGAGVALAVGLVGSAIAYVGDSRSMTSLVITRTNHAPALDGDPADPVWQRAAEAVVHTSRGFNLDGGEVAMHVERLSNGWTFFHQDEVSTKSGQLQLHDLYR
jgi:Prokaryotic cytochrome b561